MNEKELPYWLMLAYAPFVKANTLLKWLTKTASIAELFGRSLSFYQQLNCHPQAAEYLRQPDWSIIADDLKWLRESATHHLLTINRPDFPLCLFEIQDPPLLLYVKGHLEVLSSQQIAIVGSRKPTPPGKEIAYRFAYELGTCGLTITSGLAVGIDTAAHQGALKSSRTVAVLGSGMQTLYPKSNTKLAEEICETGALVTEFVPSMPPLAANFPRRNRIVSGLSLGSLIIEANLKSGSLITANYAANQGRDVFAVPGSLHNPLSRGCHSLIKQGAKLVECVQDILEELNIYVPAGITEFERVGGIQNRLDEAHRKLLECVGYEPTPIDVLVVRSDLSFQRVVSMMLDLEQAGSVRSLLGGYMRVT